MDGSEHRREDATAHPVDAASSRPVAVSARAPAQRALRIELRAPATVRRYVGRIAKALETRGHRVSIVVDPTAQTPDAIDWLLYFERLAYRTDASSFARNDVDGFLSPLDESDLTIDLAGATPERETPTLRLVFDDCMGEVGLLAALLSSRSPSLDVVATQMREPARIVRHACLAVERPMALGSSLDSVTARLATIVVQAADDLARDGHSAGITVAQPAWPTLPTLPFAARALARRLVDRVVRHVRRVECWRIAVRDVAGDGVMERRDWEGAPWRGVRDDGQRYFADPFLFAFEGRRWLFCEEFPQATAKGILSVAQIDDDGRIGPMRPILEASTHLSWPQVFTHGGQIYMIPETVAAGCVQLWRAEDFPTRWVLDRVLIENLRAHDPVLHLTSRGAFLLATIADDGGSSWDAFGLFRAPDLFGTWGPADGNPLFVDAGCARAAGPLVRRPDGLWRAAQDCRGGYGRGLALCRVTRLDEGGFAQDVMARLGPPAATGARGVHTLSRLGNLEAIDLRGPRRMPLRA